MKRALLLLVLAACTGRAHPEPVPCAVDSDASVPWGEPVFTGPCSPEWWEGWSPRACVVTEADGGPCSLATFRECRTVDGGTTTLYESEGLLVYEQDGCTQRRTR